MKHGPRIDHPVGTVPKNESIKIDNDTKIFCGITGLVIVPVAGKKKKLFKIVRPCNINLNCR